APLKLLSGRRGAWLRREEIRVCGRVSLGTKAGLDQEHLDPALVEGLERVGQPGGATSSAPELAAKAFQQLVLALSLVLGDDRGHLAGDLGGAGADVDLDPAGDAVAQVAMQLALDLSA